MTDHRELKKFQRQTAQIQNKHHLDNNNCALSFFDCVKSGGDYFGPRYFSPEEKYGGPKQSPTNSHNDRCKVIIVINNLYGDILIYFRCNL